MENYGKIMQQREPQTNKHGHKLIGYVLVQIVKCRSSRIILSSHVYLTIESAYMSNDLNIFLCPLFDICFGYAKSWNFPFFVLYLFCPLFQFCNSFVSSCLVYVLCLQIWSDFFFLANYVFISLGNDK